MDPRSGGHDVEGLSSKADRSSLIGWDGVPDLIGRNEGGGSGGIVLGTEVPGVGFKLL